MSRPSYAQIRAETAAKEREEKLRGTGRTTKQIVDAPKSAIFLWRNHILAYPKQIARDNNRLDLLVVSPSWILERRWLGLHYYGIVVDHSVALSRSLMEQIDLIILKDRT